MGQSLYRYIAHRLSRLDVYIGMYGICGLLKWSKIKWMKTVKNFLRSLKTLKSKWFGEKKKERKLEGE